MNSKNKRTLLFIGFSLLCTCLFTFPYLVKDFLPLEHDTLFHLSRIEGLAQAFKHGDFIPRIYPLKNLGFGYASPLFYADTFLLIPALLYNVGVSLSTTYSLIILVSTFLSCYFAMLFVYKISKNMYAPFLAGILYLFCNYRITDVYIRGALGEVMSFIFLPLILLGIYYVLYENESKWPILVVGFTGLVLTHNISFFLACILFAFFIIFRLKFLYHHPIRLKNIAKAAALSFLLSAFFILPMIEQLQSQDFYLNAYTSVSSLQESTLPVWKYFANQTVFGFGSTDTSPEQSMLLNVGYFLMFAPLIYLFIHKKVQPFIYHCLLIGYILLLLPLNMLPWKYFSFFSLIQFSWRLLMISSICLLVPASLVLFEFKLNKRIITILLSILLLTEGVYHILPVLNRTFGITSKTSYTDLLDGSIIDPFYSAHYVRVELAGADYLPKQSPDFRELNPVITDINGNSVSAILINRYDTQIISNIKPYTSFTLPKTYYKGYQVYSTDTSGKIISEVKTYPTPHALIGFDASDSSTYLLKYKPTFIQNFSLLISLSTLIALLIIRSKRFMHK